MDSLRESIRASLGDASVVERELTGGMSCVFVAEDRALSRRVLIKVLHPQLAASVSAERFRVTDDRRRDRCLYGPRQGLSTGRVDPDLPL